MRAIYATYCRRSRISRSERYAMYYHQRYHPPAKRYSSTTANPYCQAIHTNRDTQAIQQYSRLRYVLPSIPPAEFAIKRYSSTTYSTTRPPNSRYASDTEVQPRITTLRYPYSTACSDTTQSLRCAHSCTRNGQQYSHELQRYATHTVQLQHVAIPPSRYILPSMVRSQLHAQRQKKRSSGDSV